MLTGAALIVGILHFLGPNQMVSTGTLIIVSAVVAVVALSVSINEGRRIYKRTVAQKMLTTFYDEGREFIRDQSQPVSEQLDRNARDWISRVETCLSKYLGQSYVLQFRIHGNKTIMNDMSLLQWWEIQGRVEKLEKFLSELGSGS